VSLHRLRVDTAAAGFATLVVLPVWNIQTALGADEWTATRSLGVALFALSVVALGLQRTRWARTTVFHVETFGEDFQVSGFLRDFVLFAWCEILLCAALWVAVVTSGSG
jgi:hypothetical protein